MNHNSYSFYAIKLKQIKTNQSIFITVLPKWPSGFLKYLGSTLSVKVTYTVSWFLGSKFLNNWLGDSNRKHPKRTYNKIAYTERVCCSLSWYHEGITRYQSCWYANATRNALEQIFTWMMTIFKIVCLRWLVLALKPIIFVRLPSFGCLLTDFLLKYMRWFYNFGPFIQKKFLELLHYTLITFFQSN